MIPPEKIESMQVGFVRTLGRVGIEPAEVYPAFDRLVEAHQQPHRHYHDLEHVAEMLKVVGRLSDLAPDPLAVTLAVWFHDAVYDPQSKDNEPASARLAGEVLSGLRLDPKLISRVADLVMVTAHTGDPTDDADAMVLLDADLAILGADEKRYRRYADAVRREYAHVPDDAYRAGRATVLKSFLKRDAIYRTTRMHQTGEEFARINLRREIHELTGENTDAL